MKLMIKFLSVAIVAAVMTACGGQAPEEVNLNDEAELRSYAVGAASLREARQLIDNVIEQYPDMNDADKQSVMIIGFVDLLHLQPRVEVERFEFELSARGISDNELLSGLPAIQEFALSEDDEVGEMLYTLGAYMAVQVLMVDDFLRDYDKHLTGSAVVAGFSDALRSEGRLTNEEIDQQWEMIRDILTQPAPGAEPAVDHLSVGLAYQEENASRAEVTVTSSGLQYEVLRSGDGERPTATDVVKVHYEGTLVNGSKFDSSYDRGEPISFPLNRVIAGWTEGLQLMQVGAKYRFVIPAELAYGSSERAGGAIPANSTLVFEVELIEINPED